jgi:hypothetical protein
MSDPGEFLIIDLGKHKRGLVRDLLQGSGPLMEELRAEIAALKHAGELPEDTTPVVVVVREKRRRKDVLW